MNWFKQIFGNDEESNESQIILCGDLAHFPIVGCVQYLHHARSSGLLLFKRADGLRADFWFRTGHIIRSKGPRMPDIGSILRDRGHITENVLNRSLRLQQSSEGKKMLGSVLVKLGVITPEMVRDAIIQQIQYVIGTVLAWREGNFAFLAQDHISPDGILVQPSEIIHPGEVNIEHILLEAVSKYDESRRKQ